MLHDSGGDHLPILNPAATLRDRDERRRWVWQAGAEEQDGDGDAVPCGGSWTRQEGNEQALRVIKDDIIVVILQEKASDEDQGPETNNGDHSANGNGDEKYDKLELRNRTVTETLSLVKDLGQDNKEEEKAEEEGGEKFDKLELRNRTVTETMSLVSDFGKNEKEDDDEEPVTKKQKFDTLSLRNRDVTETLSPLENWIHLIFFSQLLYKHYKYTKQISKNKKCDDEFQRK